VYGTIPDGSEHIDRREDDGQSKCKTRRAGREGNGHLAGTPRFKRTLYFAPLAGRIPMTNTHPGPFDVTTVIGLPGRHSSKLLHQNPFEEWIGKQIGPQFWV